MRGHPLALLLLVACTCAEEAPLKQSPSPPPTARPREIARLPPGAPPRDATLSARLDEAWRARGPGFRPRTRHLLADGSPRYVNRLALERSPYLLQHAHNPVDWRPWGEAAFSEARARGVPVLLSVGYSTCHWCHVMEEESFEDEAIAERLNAGFVAIKVDREERPDVDSIYMKAVNALTGRGGWPMTVVMTPEGQPFFAGTYFPPRAGVRGARRGLFEILEELSRRYAGEREALLADAERLSRQVQRMAEKQRPGDLPGPEALRAFVQQLEPRFDAGFGGFGGAPKFPQAATLELLLRANLRFGDEGALRMAETTLEQMARGGIYDQVGGGFHRYATDARWLVPHFEKMLYDNAQLAAVYLSAWQRTGKALYRRVTVETLDYLLREMRAEGGGFHSATDADSEGEEGRFFVWSAAQIDGVLGAERGARFRQIHGVSERGNFEGSNVLSLAVEPAAMAPALGMSAEALEAELAESRAALYRARAGRPAPLRDDKVIAGWNGLAIGAFARAGLALDEPRYLRAAEQAARFVLDVLVVDGRLRRAWLDSPTAHEGFCDDYAFMIAACLDLLEATGELGWLDAALALQRGLDARFADPAGGYFYSAADGEKLLAREKPSFDGAVPGGNSVAAENLLRLHHLTLEPAWEEKAHALLRSYGGHLAAGGGGLARMLLAVDLDLARVREIAVVLPGAEQGGALLDVLRARYLPHRALMVLPEARIGAAAERCPWLADKKARGGRPTAYVCEKGRCELPASEPEVLAAQLGAAPAAPPQ